MGKGEFSWLNTALPSYGYPAVGHIFMGDHVGCEASRDSSGRRFHSLFRVTIIPTTHTSYIHPPPTAQPPWTELPTTMSPTTVLKRPQAPSASALLASPKAVKNSKPLANSSAALLTYGCGRSPISSLVH